MTYSEALDYIHSVSWKGSRPGLSRTLELCGKLGNPQKQLHFLHVAGTNGKGSTSAMLASILKEAGYRVGLYTSPFIVRFNERMQVNGTDISDEELAEVTDYVRPFADGMEDSPTEFELITAIALVYFARHNCDYVVFEVGMGGRLDSTNIIEKEQTVVSVITGIALDHTAFLGDTVAKIAAEKAGIIKEGVPVVFGGMHPPVGEKQTVKLSAHAEADPRDAAAVIAARAAEMQAPYVEVDHKAWTLHHADLFGADFDCGERRNLHIPLSGLYQLYNAATVLTVIDTLQKQGIVIPEDAVRSGLMAVRWPARFEILSRDPLVIADGGHNFEGINAAVESVRRYFGDEKIYLLSGVMADKDYDRMVARMSEVAEKAFTVRPGNDRALNPGEYAAVFTRHGVEASSYDTVEAGVRAAVEAARQDGRVLLCLGSLYMYGEVREAVLRLMQEKI